MIPGLDPALMKGISLELGAGLAWDTAGGRKPIVGLPALVSICAKVRQLRHFWGTFQHAFFSAVPCTALAPHTRRRAYSTALYPCVTGWVPIDACNRMLWKHSTSLKNSNFFLQVVKIAVLAGDSKLAETLRSTFRGMVVGASWPDLLAGLKAALEQGIFYDGAELEVRGCCLRSTPSAETVVFIGCGADRAKKGQDVGDWALLTVLAITVAAGLAGCRETSGQQASRVEKRRGKRRKGDKKKEGGQEERRTLHVTPLSTPSPFRHLAVLQLTRHASVTHPPQGLAAAVEAKSAEICEMPLMQLARTAETLARCAALPATVLADICAAGVLDLGFDFDRFPRIFSAPFRLVHAVCRALFTVSVFVAC